MNPLQRATSLAAHSFSYPPDRRGNSCQVESLEPRFLLAVNVLSYHNDNSNTGQNLAETALTQANVNPATFGKIFSTTVDGQIYAQPLLATGINISTGPLPGIHNVVFVATEHDSLYAIDANFGTILWSRSFINPAAGVTTVPSADVGTTDISPEIGITSTPAIDPATNRLYLTAKTKEIIGGVTHYFYRLHAINISDGSEALGGPIVIADTGFDGINYTFFTGPFVNGSGDGNVNGLITFNALIQLQRPAVTIANGTIWLGFGSHGDNGPYHGWILGYSTTDMHLSAVFNTSPNASAAAIWQGGGKIAVDAGGNLFVATGNGTFDTTLNVGGFPSSGDFGDSVIRLAIDPTSTFNNQNTNGWGLKVVDYFTPFNQDALAAGDEDLGSTGPLLLPSTVGSVAHPNLMLVGDKAGNLYLIDRDNMGKFSALSNRIVQQLPSVLTKAMTTPAFFNNTIYISGALDESAKAFSITNAHMTLVSQTSDSFSYPGASPSISANGAANGILWALDRMTDQLRAYSAGNLAAELYTSGQAPNGRDQLLGDVVKFTSPTVANGQVFVGTSNALVGFGLIASAVPAPTLGVYRPSISTFFLAGPANSGNANLAVNYGIPGDKPIVGDWNGNGTTTIGVYRPGNATFYLRNTNTPGNADLAIQYGTFGDIPVVGDWDGNGTMTVGVYRPGNATFYLRNSNTAGPADIAFQYGAIGDIPLTGDWNGNGMTTVGVYRPGNATFYLRNSNTAGSADLAINFGPANATPIVGDWNGDGLTTIGIYNQNASTFFLRNTNTSGLADEVFNFGINGDDPLVGKWS